MLRIGMVVLALALAGAVPAPFSAARAGDRDQEAHESASPEGQGNEAQEEPSATSISVRFTNFLAFKMAGDGDGGPKFSGKVDGYIVVDGRDLGLWDGFSINAHPEVFYGRTFNAAGMGTLLPLNTSMYRGNGKEDDIDLSLNFTQKFGKASLTLGKISMFEKAAGTPIAGGGGLDGFQHLQLAAPVSFNTPPYVFGGLLSVPFEGASFTLGVWDADDVTGRSGFEHPFERGIDVVGTLTIPVTIGGRQGFYGLTVGGTTADSLDLNDIPEIILPPVGGTVVSQKEGGWQVKFAFQQYVWQDEANPQRGWGLFGYASLWDGNPTLARWSMAFGAAGSSPIASRPLDRFGLGYFYFKPSDALIRGLEPVVELGSEQGAEAFYTLAITRNFLVTANLQLVDPATRINSTAIVGGLRTSLRF